MSKTKQRAFLYLVLAIGPALQQGIPNVHSIKDGVLLAVGVMIAGATTLRAFIDTTPADEAIPSNVRDKNPALAESALQPEKPLVTTQAQP